MKKSLAFLLSLVLMFTAMPFALSASAADYVAEVVETGTQYESVANAFNACQTGETVRLLKDTTVVYLGGNVSHIMGRTIDLNGYTLTCTGERFISPGSRTGDWSVTVKNGTLTNEGIDKFQSFAMVRANSTVTFEDLTIYECATSRPNGYGFIGTVTAATGVLNFKNCKIYECAVNTVQQYSAEGSTVNMYNTTVESYTSVFYTKSTYNVYSGSFTALGDSDLATPTIPSTSTVTTNEAKKLVVECNHSYADGVCSYCGNKETVETVIDLSMKAGASIRLNDQNGIRFYTTVDAEKLAALKAVEGNTVELGTLIAPADLVTDELTHEIGEANFIDVKYVADEYYEENTFVGSIVEIKEANYGRAFIGRGYVKVTDANGEVTYYYATQDDNSRSLKVVANALKNDSANTALYEANKDLVDTWAAAADWSPAK